MSKQEEADLILKLYDLRREAVMRQARDWYVREFNPESAADIKDVMFSEHSGHLRMVMSYWEMAAALVNDGAIRLELFNGTNGEHFMVFAKVEPFLSEMRSEMGPQFLTHLEKMIDETPQGRERLAIIRERMQLIRKEYMAKTSKAAGRK